jgi:hypothetical protein
MDDVNTSDQWDYWLRRGEYHLARHVIVSKARANGRTALMHKLVERAALNQYVDHYGLGSLCAPLPAKPGHLKMNPIPHALCAAYPN